MADLHPALLMLIAARYVETRVRRSLSDAGFELSAARSRVLACVGENGTRLTDLAEQAQITKQSAGFLVDQLERAGYAERVPDPSDARARLVRMAPRGLEAQRAARQVEREIAREWEQHLGSERMVALQDALTALREITDPWA